MKKGKLIVIEGMDGSGKTTQIDLLMKGLEREKKGAVVLDFPNYTTPTGKIVRRYLDGEFGPANDIPAKIASIFYAEDRFASKKLIQDELDKGSFTILDRYVESSMGHQGGKIRDRAEREEYVKWLEDLEYGNFGLPRPDAVVFLHMPQVVSRELMLNRKTKPEFHPGKISKDGLDGHESSEEHMRNAEESYLHLAELFGWITIHCAPDGTMASLKTPKAIHREICEKLGVGEIGKREIVFSMKGMSEEERAAKIKELEKRYGVKAVIK